MDYDARQAVHLPVTDYLKLDLYLMDAHPGVKLDAFVTDLVKRWLAVEMERSALRERGQAMRGFQWKNVFLPERQRTQRLAFCLAAISGERLLGTRRHIPVEGWRAQSSQSKIPLRAV